MAFGVTENGFNKPTDAEIEEILVTLFKNEFGSSIILEPETFLGQQLQIIKKRELELWDVIENVYYASFASTSSGVNLDRTLFPFVRLPAQKSVVTLTFTGDDSSTIPEGTIVETTTGVQFETTEEGEILDTGTTTGEVDVLARSVLAGSDQNFPVDSITEIPVAIAGIDSVTNNTAATGGKDIESDADFFARAQEEATGTKSSSIFAIENALKSLDDIIQATVLENDTDVTDANGLPPHSIQAIINGTASDEDIANTIFENKAGGINTFGGESFDVEFGEEIYTINFSRSSQINVYVDVKLTTDSSYDSEFDDVIKLRVLEYIGGVDSEGNEYEGLTAGQDVLNWKVAASLFNLSDRDDLGILDVEIELGTFDDPSSTSNLAIAPTEEAITDLSFITVEII